MSQDDKNRINFLQGILLNRNKFLTLKRELLGWAAANESLLNKPMFIDSQITPNQILELLLLVSEQKIESIENNPLFADLDNELMQHIREVIIKELKFKH